MKMIYQLDQNNFDKVRPLFAELEEYNFSISGVLNGNYPGRIYVDDVDKPQTAFLYSSFWYFLTGNVNNDKFNQAIKVLIESEDFANDYVRGDKGMMFMAYHPAEWNNQVPSLFGGHPPFEVPRRRHLFEQISFDWRERIPEGFTVRRIDKNLLENDQLANIEGVRHWVNTYWGAAVDVFHQRGVGVCLMRDNQIASWCIMVNVAGKCCELGVETAYDFRQQGLGTIAVAATVELCLDEGFTSIDWHCNIDHLGSLGVAEGAGFVKERDYISFRHFFDLERHVAFAVENRYGKNKTKDNLTNHDCKT